MSSRRDIEAGKAYVEVAVKDANFRTGLARARARLEMFAASVGSIGDQLRGLDSAIAAGLGSLLAGGALASMVSMFAAVGSQIHDTSTITGVAAESLSAIAHAAKLSGVEMEGLTAAFRGMAKFTAQVVSGKADKVLSMLGINAADFLRLNPEGRFLLIAEALSRVEDETLRAALAAATLGKSGASLLPMFENGAQGIKDAMTDAARLGLVTSKEEAAAADEFGDAWDDLRAVLSQSAQVIGSQLVPALLPMVRAVTEAIVTTNQFLSNNATLVQSLAMIAGAAIAAGSAFTIFSGIAIGVNAMLGIATTLLPIVAAGFSAIGASLAIPLALAAAFTIAIAGIGVALYQISPVFQGVVNQMAGGFGLLLGTVQEVLGGIFNAIVSGDWQLAGQIMSQAIGVAVSFGLLALREMWADFSNWIFARLQQLKAAVVGMADSALQAVGSNRLSATAERERERARTIEADQEKQKEQMLAGPKDELQRQYNELDEMLRRAAEARSKMASDATIKFGELNLPSLGNLGAAMPAQSTATTQGTFSGAIAGLLGRMGGNDFHERTAKATEKMADLLGELNNKEMGIAFE